MRCKLWAICNTVNNNKRGSIKDWRDIKPNIVKTKKGNPKGNTNQPKGVKKPQLRQPRGRVNSNLKQISTHHAHNQAKMHTCAKPNCKKLCVTVHDHRTHILTTSNELDRQHESKFTHLQLSALKHQKLKNKLSFLIIEVVIIIRNL